MTLPNSTLDRLKEGNKRWVDCALDHPRRDEERRLETIHQGQNPFAAILSCADSRSPVEMVFDQGLGDLFSVRTAGNVFDDLSLGSLELGIYKFDIPIMLVLGHTHCGAIKLALENKLQPGSINHILNKIQPAVERVQQRSLQLSAESLEFEVIKENALGVVDDLLRESKIIRDRVKSGKTLIVAGLHHLHSGVVEWFE